MNTLLDEIKNKFNNILSDDNRQIYANMTPVDVFHHLLEIVDEHEGFEMIGEEEHLLDLLTELKNSKLHQYCMNLAIFLGTIEEPEKYQFSIDHNITPEQTPPSSPSITTSNNDNSASQQQKIKIPKNKIYTSLRKLIEDSDGVFQMSTLIEIQRNLCKEYKLDGKNDFSSFGYGDFIQFLNDHQKTIGNSSEFYLFNADSCGGIKRKELFTFIQYLFNNNIFDKTILEKTIKYHFNLLNFKQIGFDNIEQLIERVKKQRSIPNTIPMIQ